ncbi:MAG: DMT family transporter [Phycisphaerales bacterium]
MSKPSTIALAHLGIATLVGMVTSFQPGVNKKFGEISGAPLHGSVVNFSVGLCVALVVAVAMKAPPPSLSKLSEGPAWMWLGGLIGATWVTAAIFLSPRMGQGNYFAAMIAGQMAAGLAIDHFGLMGFEPQRVSPIRLLGLLVIAAGVAMVRMK